ncbi:MAG: LysR family transcriptional regulator [Proteobacteria bacterium]|nr:MAG: LysR family transcriptional regulator [Pseudomonadota bacterium]
MSYTQLRSFQAVASEGGFTAAARVLNIGQPTVTSQVRALEERYGVELFHRRGREVSLTDAGRALFAITRRLISLEEDARDLLNAYGGFHVGELKVGAVGPYHATEMLSAFNERYPDIRLTVAMGNSKEMVQRLLDYQADVAVLAHVEDDPRIFAMPYSSHPVVVIINKSHPLADRSGLRLRDLGGQRMVFRETGSTTRLAFETALQEAGVVIDPVMEIGSREAVWLAVARDIGIGVVSDIEYIPHPDIRPIEIIDADIRTTAHVNCLVERRESRLIQAFFNVARLLLDNRRADGETT